jgi:hypothetical protein
METQKGSALKFASLISQKVFVESFGKSPFPHRFVNLSMIITNIKNKLTDSCWNWLLQNDFINALCEISRGT